MDVSEVGQEGGEAALERCLKTLKASRSDTEMFAALFLITKLAKAESLNVADRQRIFKAVGFQFINRLLHTDSPPEGCEEHLFRSLALTLLACFSTDSSLVCHSEMVDKVPILKETILLPRTTDSASPSAIVQSMISDAYDILLAMAVTEGGRERLQEIIPDITTIIAEKGYGHELACSVLSLLLYHSGSQLWTMQSVPLHTLFSQIAQDFQQFQDEDKFQSCLLLNSLLSVSSYVPPTMPDWSVKISGTLFEVLQNKLGEAHRDVCLQLASTMLHHYGAPWVLCNHERKFFLLLVNLASIEVRMILESMDYEKQVAKAGVLCSCFTILEHCVRVMVCGGEIDLSSQEVRQLHGILTGAFGAALYHLKSVTLETSNDPVVFSCVRALFMWLAEETDQLKAEIIEILPFLIKFSQTSLQESPPGGSQTNTPALPVDLFYLRLREDLLKLFLPGLCHLTAEKRPRDVILSNDGIPILVAYTGQLLKEKQKHEDSLITICNIFLNILLEDINSIGCYQDFRELFQRLASELECSGPPSTLLDLHLALVFTTLLRVKPPAKDSEVSLSGAVAAVGRMIGQAISSGANRPAEENQDKETEKNLLCLIMQCLTECIRQHAWGMKTLSDSRFIDASPSRWKGDDEVLAHYDDLRQLLSGSYDAT